MSLLNKQNYKQLLDIKNIAWEDLEDIGITRLGHQKRFMLGVKRLIDIDKGLYQPNPNKISIKSTTIDENFRKPQISPNRHRIGSSGPYIPTSSFRLPPPLSSSIISTSSTRTRSLENLNSDEEKIQYEPIVINSGEKTLSSSTESTNGIPFANENIGTIKQRSLLNSYNTYDTMKRSLPIEFIQQSVITTTPPIYDNNERFKRTQYKQIK